MAVTKKVTAVKTAKPKAPPKPKRGEVGYTFMIPCVVTDADKENDEYHVVVGLTNDPLWYEYIGMNDLIELESNFNPKVKLEVLATELKAAQAKVVEIQKQLQEASKGGK